MPGKKQVIFPRLSYKKTKPSKCRKKHKAHISKYKPYILKYMACIFSQKAYNFCREQVLETQKLLRVPKIPLIAGFFAVKNGSLRFEKMQG